MKIKDIVNRDIVNLTNCEQEPIHIPGSIQEHGFLLGLNQDTFKIEFCSENSDLYINLAYNDLLGRDFKEIFGADILDDIKKYISDGYMLSSTLFNFIFLNRSFTCNIHKSNNIYVLEAEEVIIGNASADHVYNQTSQFLNYMHDTHTFKELCSLVAKGTRQITGYDRVMIYRFDKDYNGEVFAESKREDLEPFLGLYYPHTDIPKQARELYMQNLLRLITDINYTPVPIYTIDDSTDKNLDLSLSVLRSTSPIHVKYLNNIGVNASLTISLIHQKKLWGLIACHHYSGKKNLTPEARLAAKLQGHFITSQIELRQANEEYDISRKTTLAVEAANTYSLVSGSFNELISKPELLKICNASGVSIIFNGEVYKYGVTPGNNEVLYLSNWLAAYTGNNTFNTDKLIDFISENTISCGTTSGIIYHSLNPENSNCIIWYRPETQTEVNWGGDPNKAIILDENGLSPRNSFKLWKEIVNCMSKPWLQPEKDSAATYANSLQKQINLLVITQEEERYRKLSEMLKEANSELENINWISTHDLQEPLRKIQLLSSRILVKEKEMSENVQDSIIRMNNSANRMQTLLLDILKYTRLKNTDGTFEKIEITKIVEDIKAEITESVNEQQIEINIKKLPQINGIPFLLKQLFSNIITNAVKYAHPERNPVINIYALNVPQRHPNPVYKDLYNVINISDNGIGFEQDYAESIFNIFTRLHSSTDYKGSGVGLALCKKIMQNHKGHIAAKSKPGEGTTIILYFPV